MRRGSKCDRDLDFSPLAPYEWAVIVECSRLADLNPLILRSKSGDQLLHALIVLLEIVLSFECDGQDSNWFGVFDVYVIFSGAHRSELLSPVKETHCPLALVLHQHAILVGHVAEVEFDGAGHGDLSG